MVVSEPNKERCRFVAALAAAWVRLARAAPAERRIALVLANYPNRDGRIGNGVGLDTPASTVRIMQALKEAGYRVENSPADGAALMARLTAGPTNAADSRAKPPEATLPLADYAHFFNALPAPVQATVAERWGEPEADPFFRQDVGCFALPAVRFGNVVVAIQPARGYNIDPEKSYHDPDLPPPHGYLAFYAWVRSAFDAHAVVHVGKHGNVEWLPGKALALSAECFPEAALGPLPHVYPFIVNDPGEGSQAKRRGAAVIVDHLTPPLTRAGSHGALEELERLVDEFFDAASVDPRRCPPLSARILELTASIGLDQDCGIHATDGSGDALRKLDGYLCEIKEMQIRDGLHIFGEAPEPQRRNELLRAIARSVRGPGAGEASLLRALADDLVLGIDPLSAPLGEPWRGPRPQALTNGVPWRSTGDTVERLEGSGGQPDCRQPAPACRVACEHRRDARSNRNHRPCAGRERRRRDGRPAHSPRRPLRGARCRRRTHARPARTCCRRGGTSIRWTHARCRPLRPGNWDGPRPSSWWSTTPKPTATGRGRWRSAPGARRTCARAGTTLPKRSRSSARARVGRGLPAG